MRGVATKKPKGRNPPTRKAALDFAKSAVDVLAPGSVWANHWGPIYIEAMRIAHEHVSGNVVDALVAGLTTAHGMKMKRPDFLDRAIEMLRLLHPALAVLTDEEIGRAVGRWPATGTKPLPGVNPRGRIVPWYRVVHDLLKPHGLTNADDGEALMKAWKKRARGTRGSK